MKSLRGFEVASPSKQKVQSFLEKVDAVEPWIEWGWNTVIKGHEDDPDEFQGFGYTTFVPKDLSQFATDLNVELIFINEPLRPETVQTFGLYKYVEENC